MKTTPDAAELLAVARHILRDAGVPGALGLRESEALKHLERLEVEAEANGRTLNEHLLRLNAAHHQAVLDRAARCTRCYAAGTPLALTVTGPLCPACSDARAEQVAATRDAYLQDLGRAA